MESRKILLEKLIENKSDINEIQKSLSEYDWDSEETLIVLPKEKIIEVLQSYINGVKSIAEIEDWANAIEVREDIDIDETSKTLIYLLANPALTDSVKNEAWARELIMKYQ